VDIKISCLGCSILKLFRNHQHIKIIICLLFVLFILKTKNLIAQPKVPSPSFGSFQNISSQNSFQKQQINTSSVNDPALGTNMPLGGTAADVINQANQNAMRQMGVTIPGQTNNTYKQNQLEQLEELKREEANETYSNTLAHFQNYYNQLLQLNPNKFSITKAVYLCEAVYYDKPCTYNEFLKAVQQKAGFVKQIIQQQGMSIKNPFAVQYTIQQLYSKNFTIKQPNNRYIKLKKFEYDFEDFGGDKDFTKMFVTKLLQTNSGQCHSMPLLYLCIAEQLGIKAWLSLAPGHSFIKFIDAKGNLSNFEATSGHIVSTTWLLQSNAVSTIALKNKTYLDTLSSKQLFAECLADFLMTYESKNGYDDFSQQISNDVLKIDSNNIIAYISHANYEAAKFKYYLKEYNIQSQEQINKNSIVLNAQQKMKTAQQKVLNLGYQDMPKEQYVQWLQSIEYEKAKQKSRTKK